MNKAPHDELHDLFADICRLGASPGGPMILDALFPGTLEAVKNLRITCPVCRQPHPSDTSCKPLEASDNGYTLTRRDP